MRYLLAAAMVLGLSGGAWANTAWEWICPGSYSPVVSDERTQPECFDGERKRVAPVYVRHFPDFPNGRPDIQDSRGLDWYANLPSAAGVPNFTPIEQYYHKSPHYTVNDIERMRAVVHKQVFYENCVKASDGIYLCPFPPSMAGMVEDRLRTYLSQGIRSEELEAKVK